MKGLHIDVLTVALVILGGVSDIYAQAVQMGLPSIVDGAFPGKGAHIMQILGLVSLCAGIVLRVFFNRTPQHTVQIPTTNGSTVRISTVCSPKPKQGDTP